MSPQQYNKLMEYIDARIDEKIQDAFGRDSLNESIKTSVIGAELRELFNTAKVKNDYPISQTDCRP